MSRFAVRNRFTQLATITAVCSLALVVRAETPLPTEPVVAPASEEAKQALQGFSIPAEMTGQLFAAEPMVANPVAFYIDRRGRVFVCESFRQGIGVTDNRKHDQAWLDDDLAAQSVEDRIAYHKKHLPDEAAEYTKYDDRIRMLVDEDGDGRADRATVFANRFNNIEDGTGAGVIEHNGKVYYTCIPHLWQFTDANNDGVADERTSLHNGFGVRVAFRGHDMHGLIVGPDGRLYFSIGDRGYNIVTDEGRLKDPESGAVFRCEMDGSNLEVVATGLRNPQELAFDEFGNLFTGDNNSDSGDQARWVYIVEGSDSGWRMSYQYLSDRGPFNREKIWHPFHAEQPAYIVPPVTNLADGPSGLAYYPGTGWSDDQLGRFFLCDFRGGPANSGVRSFRVKRKGAFYEVVDQEQPFWNILATDIQFGPEGGVYLSDWVNGWNGEGKGRLYRFMTEEAKTSQAVADVKQLLASDLAEQTTDRLRELLGHADQRVRQAAQFALVNNNEFATLRLVSQEDDRLLARLHAIWALGQIARQDATKHNTISEACVTLLEDTEVEVRCQATKLLGELKPSEASESLIAALADSDARVRYFAANSLGKLGTTTAFDAVVAMLEDNDNTDPIVRHGGIMALAGVADAAELETLQDHHALSVRLAAVVALRRQHAPEISSFLRDASSQVVLEAARAIHDLPIQSELPSLAALIKTSANDDALLRRVLNANFRLGQPQNAEALATFAAQSERPTAMQVEALDMLENWQNPSNRDRLLGLWRPLAERSHKPAADALTSELAAVLTGENDVRVKATSVALSLGLPEAGDALQKLFADSKQPAQVRADAILGLASLDAKGTVAAINSSLSDDSSVLRAAARTALAMIKPKSAIGPLRTALLADTTIERQAAAAAIATIESEAADHVIAAALTRLIAGEVPADSQLDILEAAATRSTKPIADLLARFEASRAAEDPLANYREAIFGGNAERGKNIFLNRTDLSCARCHRIDGRGGRVGPDLSGIAIGKTRDYLMEALVAPNRTIAKGFESVMVADEDGQVHVGILKEETDELLTIMTADGKLLTLEQDAIEARRPGQSPMPEDIVKKVSKRDLRDLVEYLAQRKTPAEGEKHE